MKRLALTLVVILNITLVNIGLAQKATTTKKDSVYIIKTTDDMTDKTYYFISRGLVSIDNVNKQGFRLEAFLKKDESTNKIYMTDLKAKLVNIGSCNEKVTLIFKFEDESKIQLTSWNDFNCEGKACYELSDSDKESLSTKKIVKIKFQNGRDGYESYTADITNDNDYYVQLFDAINKQKIKEEKSK